MIGAIEAGGTKFVCAVGGSHHDIWAQEVIPTRMPDETLAACSRFFETCQIRYGVLSGLGIAAFGPIDLSRNTATYGTVLTTPKPGWQGANFVHHFSHQLGLRPVVDTDVNAAILAEVKAGAARGCKNAVYITVGTGVGVMVDGQLLHGLMHPEAGHVPVPRAAGDEKFHSECPFHSDCVEGMASGPAMASRWAMPASILPPDHMAWDMEAYYLAQLCRTLTLVYAPERIVMGGGVMNQKSLLPRIRRQLEKLLAGYVPVIPRAGGIDRYVVAPELGKISGLAGAFLLASGRY